MTIRVTRGIQCGESQIRGSKGVWVHGNFLFSPKIDRYDCDQVEERNTMRSVSNKGVGRPQTFFFTPIKLYSDLKNTTVLKGPNS